MSEEQKQSKKGEDVLSLLLGLAIGGFGTAGLFFLYKLMVGGL